jgi:hypothetical protein
VAAAAATGAGVVGPSPGIGVVACTNSMRCVKNANDLHHSTPVHRMFERETHTWHFGSRAHCRPQLETVVALQQWTVPFDRRAAVEAENKQSRTDMSEKQNKQSQIQKQKKTLRGRNAHHPLQCLQNSV